MDTVDIANNESLDEFFGGSISLIQPKKGYRFSIDAILLANFIINSSGNVIDLGTGCGIIPAILGKNGNFSNIIGVELQEELFKIASRNILLNELHDKITIINEDISNLKKHFEPESFDQIVSNPPYIPLNEGRLNPEKQRAIARHEVMCSIDSVLEISRYLVKPSGKVSLVYPCTRMVDLMMTLRKRNLEPLSLQLIYSGLNTDSKIFLVEAAKKKQVI